MNKQQLQTMATRLNLKPLTIEACELALIEGVTYYAAEIEVYGKRMGTIGKACKRLRDELKYCVKVDGQGRAKFEPQGTRGAK